MQITVENLTSLERKCMITLPAMEMDQEVISRLHEVAKKAKIDGFRPGKVPFAVIQKRYKDAITAEVIEAKIKSSYMEMLREKQFNPVAPPQVDKVTYATGKDFSYEAIFEIYPKIEITDLANIEVEKINVDITASDVDKVLESLRAQHASWHETETEAENGDRVTLTYDVFIAAESVIGGAKEETIQLNSKNILPEIYKSLVGAKKEATFNVAIQYPADYPEKKLADKKAEFRGEVKKVLRAELPALSDEFLTKLGITAGDVSALREKIQQKLTKEAASINQKRFYHHILEKLGEVNKFDLPKVLITHEIARLRHLQNERQKDVPHAPILSDEKLQTQAENNVRFSLLMGKIIEMGEIKVTSELLDAKFAELAAGTEMLKSIKDWYYKDATRLQELQMMILEEELVKYLEPKIKVTLKSLPFSEVSN